MTTKKKSPGKRGPKFTLDVDELCENLREYFFKTKAYEIKKKEVVSAGRSVVITEEVPCAPPTLHGFRATYGIPKSTFHDYVKRHKKLSDVLEECKDFVADMIICHSYKGESVPVISKMLLTAHHPEYREKQEVEQTGEIKVVLPDERATKL